MKIYYEKETKWHHMKTFVLGSHNERCVKLFISNEQQTAFKFLVVNSYCLQVFRVPLSKSIT